MPISFHEFARHVLPNGQTEAGRYLEVVYVPDPGGASAFIVTAYDITPNAKRAYRRRGKERIMSTTVTDIVTNGVVVPCSPLPEGANVEVTLVVPEKPELRGVPAEQVRGIAAGAGPLPDDETVNRWIQECRAEKCGRSPAPLRPALMAS